MHIHWQKLPVSTVQNDTCMVLYYHIANSLQYMHTIFYYEAALVSFSVSNYLKVRTDSL